MWQEFLLLSIKLRCSVKKSETIELYYYNPLSHISLLPRRTLARTMPSLLPKMGVRSYDDHVPNKIQNKINKCILYENSIRCVMFKRSDGYSYLVLNSKALPTQKETKKNSFFSICLWKEFKRKLFHADVHYLKTRKLTRLRRWIGLQVKLFLPNLCTW